MKHSHTVNVILIDVDRLTNKRMISSRLGLLSKLIITPILMMSEMCSGHIYRRRIVGLTTTRQTQPLSVDINHAPAAPDTE